MGSMPRYLCSLLLVIAFALFGVLPHAAMAADPQKMAVPCHAEQTVTSGRADAIAPCGSVDHSMSGACAIACLGTMATWFAAPDPSPMAYRPVAYWAADSLVLNGRTDETADRPPESI